MPRKPIEYPTVEGIIQANKRVLKEIRVKKADRHQVFSRETIAQVLKKAQARKGDVYDKAAILLAGLVRSHAFASGVRRTAIVTTASFLKMNGQNLRLPFDTEVLKGIREEFYTIKEIKYWLKGREIRKFERT